MAGFKKAVKHESKLRLALAGPAGSGKTYSALAIATALANGAPIALIDTERGSASKYADLFSFDVLELEPPYHPDRYIAALREAQEAGYAVLIIDSLTHAWNGAGGLLELHEQVVKRQTNKNSYTAWAEITPIQNRLIDAITGSGLHLIATMRSKTEYVQNEANGKKQITKVGTSAIQRDGMEFEFDIYGQMDLANSLIIEKTRCPALTGAIIDKPGAEVARTLRDWLAGEAAPERKPEPEPPNPAFEALHLRAKTALEAIGKQLTVESWQDTCQQFGGAVKPSNMTTEGKKALAAHVASLEKDAAKHKATQATAPATKRTQTQPAKPADDAETIAFEVADDASALEHVATTPVRP